MTNLKPAESHASTTNSSTTSPNPAIQVNAPKLPVKTEFSYEKLKGNTSQKSKK